VDEYWCRWIKLLKNEEWNIWREIYWIKVEFITRMHFMEVYMHLYFEAENLTSGVKYVVKIFVKIILAISNLTIVCAVLIITEYIIRYIIVTACMATRGLHDLPGQST
jgi:hypothetical protein